MKNLYQPILLISFLFLGIQCQNASKEAVKELPKTKTMELEIVDKTEEIRSRLNPEVSAVVEKMPPALVNLALSRENIVEQRARIYGELPPFESDIATLIEKTITAKGKSVKILIYEPKEKADAPSPALMWIHGGGYVMGQARSDGQILPMLAAINGPVIAVDYSLAPEYPFPTAIEECFTVLNWLREHAAELHIDAEKIAIGGTSAGAGMAAGLALYSRDHKGPKIAYQLLHQPMLDNLHELPGSSVLGHLLWDRPTSLNAWEMYLNGTPGKDASPYAAAMRAKDLSGLPPALITVGELDLFKDECVLYAKRLKEAGIETELITYAGAMHGTEAIAGFSKIAQKIVADRQAALKKFFAL